MISLRTRLILTASLVLSIFIVVAGYTLERAFYRSAEKSLQDSLRAHLNLLMASADIDPRTGAIEMSARLLDTQFSLPSSGLYGVILNEHGKPIWKSLSTVGVTLPAASVLPAGEESLHSVEFNAEEFSILNYGLLVYGETGQRTPLTFSIIAELQPFNTQVYAYRRTLFGWLAGLAVALLIVQWLILAWGLQPLRKVRDELRAVDQARQESINARYPSEIAALTETINDLLAHEHAQKTRYRNALADLAHSLKTPLAVVRGVINELPAELEQRHSLDEQIQRMDHIIAHQLQRAAMAGGAGVRRSLDLMPLLQKITGALNKVYRDKNLQFDLPHTQTLKARVDEGDAMELLGNLLDNACKWCQRRVQIQIESSPDRLQFCINDDGPGIAADHIQHILQRGGRLDQAMPGQGIGLSVAHEILNAYQGSLTISRSTLGGAAFCFTLPAGE